MSRIIVPNSKLDFAGQREVLSRERAAENGSNRNPSEGGHALQFIVENAVAKVQRLNYINVILPDTLDFYRMDFTTDLSSDMQKVIKPK